MIIRKAKKSDLIDIMLMYKSCVNGMIKNGIDPSRIKANGFGESRPIATNNTPEGRQTNRRTEVHIIKD